MKMTLLEMTQMILSAMDSDEVNSISDTTESNQVALLIKGVYYDMANDLALRKHETLFELEASGSSTKPVLMTVPSNVIECHTLKYDNKADADTGHSYYDVEWIPFQDFMQRQNGLDATASNVGVMEFTVNSETFEINYRTDAHPSYYTDIGGVTLLFDSFNSDVDTTLQKSKTMCTGIIYPTFSMTDSFIPDLDVAHFPYFINKAKSRAFVELKQMQNADASNEARRQKIVLQNRDRKVNRGPEFNRLPKYGRK